MDIFSDDKSGSNIDRVELARKSIAEVGGAAIGNGASHIKEKQDAQLREQRAAHSSQLTALQIALQDAGYRQLYDTVWQKIDQTQFQLDQAMLENSNHIETLEDNAMRTKEGRLVFVTGDGFVYGDGTQVDDKDLPTQSDIPATATSWDDYQTAIQRREKLARVQTDTLDPIRDKMSDPDNPPDKPTLKGFDKRLDDATNAIEFDGAEPQVIDIGIQLSEFKMALPEPL